MTSLPSARTVPKVNVTLDMLKMFSKFPHLNHLFASLPARMKTDLKNDLLKTAEQRLLALTPPVTSLEVQQRFALWHGDLTQFAADVVIVPATPDMRLTGELNFALHRACGPGLKKEMLEKAGFLNPPVSDPTHLVPRTDALIKGQDVSVEDDVSNMLLEKGVLVTGAGELTHVQHIVHVLHASPSLYDPEASLERLRQTLSLALHTALTLTPKPKSIILPTIGMTHNGFSNALVVHTILQTIQSILLLDEANAKDDEKTIIVIAVYAIEIEALFNELLVDFFA